jgi:hypothetical protein
MAQVNLNVRVDDKPIDDYFTGKNMERLMHSIGQAERGEVVKMSLEEMEEMLE